MGPGESSNKLMLEVSKLNISLSTHHGGFRNRDQYYLPGPLFGPYSFVNISCGKEEMDDDNRHNWKNMVEVAVVFRVVQNLYKAWKGFRKQLSIAVASPYTAQVDEIKDKLGEKYKNLDKFIVKVLTFDELQGKEEDIILLSTVRSNCDGSLGLLSNNERVNNVALTRARHCLWILGNERTLSKNDSVWKSIICDAKNRNCFFNIEEDKEMSDFVNEIKKELDQLDEVFDANSPLFKNARWKVLFSDNFRKSFGKIKSLQMKKLVMNLLLRLANGWRPKQRNVGIICDKSKLALKQFKVKDLYVICSVDIDHEEFRYIQVLRVWDLLPLVDIPKLVKRLDSMFLTHTDEFLNHCKEKCIEGGLEIPMSWETSHHIVRHKKSSCIQEGNNERRFLKDSKVGDSLLLTKFYSISSGMVSNLLSSCNGTELELPFELTRQEMEIINFGKSSFILGRSGTGKTTVLIRKLVQIEQLYHVASEGFHEFKGCRSSKFEIAEDGERVEESKETFLHQIFVTLNPRLCCAVKQHVSGLTRFACGEKSAEDSTSIRLDDMDDVSNFEEIPDSFVDLPPNLYPLVITFHKFLIMLDGTLGNSFFDRFPEAKEDSHESTKSMALTTFIRMKEVNFDKFNISYWPLFKKTLTNGLDPSTVFAEIMSKIKGGLRAWNVPDGKLSCKDYISLSSSRVSTLSEPEMQKIYEIFMQYEKKKKMNVEYDLADLVTDLHRRLKEKEYEAAKFDFVYIDEVQDLTMGQIALFRHVCRNVADGFVFAGDTAQTIAKGIDFRFEDIRHLFYEEFVMKSRGDRIYGRGQKGVIAGISQLSQNFRTHAGVLKLAQSVIDLVYHFFPLSIDPLNPETSLIDGETPVLVESRNGKIEFSFMLSNSGDCGRSLVGFGADQVVLVRDDSVKNEILKYSGNHALILTISECKGLEFQDVLLYNFLSSSPIKEQWNLIYTFMKEKNILGHTSRWSFPCFEHAKHRLLCSELKQLYVAITRTRQRLWIIETGDGEGFSAPLCDYWKTMQVVKVRGLDDSFLEEIQVCSSKEEWKSRGIKLFNEQKYEPAKMCFERAGEAFLAKWAEASGLRAAAWNISTSNSDVAGIYLKNAATIFNSIGEFEAAAKCFYESKEFNLAGSIYLEKFGDSKLHEAGECFVRARSYERAAFAYAKGNFFTKCLESCLQGKLFNRGLHYIPYWKDHATQNNYMTRDMNEIDAIEQKLLKGAAVDYKKLGDKSAMMKCVKAFNSWNSMRNFLKTEGCLEELIQLESEWGNFMDAATIAKEMGETLLEAELLEMGKHYKEASLVILFYVLANSLWVLESKGWPLKHFTGKKELLDKAETLADNVSTYFHKLVWIEKTVLSDERLPLSGLQQLFSDSERCRSVGGEILSAWKILDVHFSVSSSKYVWQFHAENGLSENQVSVKTLVFFWNVWKTKIEKIFDYLGHLQSDDVYGEFCLNYMGVRMIDDFDNNKTIYLLLQADAHWLKQISYNNLRRRGRFVSCNAKQFAHAARCYWTSEMFSVGRKVLASLKALYEFPKDMSLFLHCQVLPLVHMYSVAKSLIESKFLLQNDHDKELNSYLDLSMDDFLVNLLSLNWREPLMLRMTNLRETKILTNFVEDLICKVIDKDNQFAHAAQCSMSSDIVITRSKVFESLRALYEFSNENSLPLHCEARPLVHMHAVAKSLIDSKLLLYKEHDWVFSYLELSMDNILGITFPPDWRKPLTMEMIIERETKEFKDLVEDIICRISSSNSHLTYQEIGKVVMAVLGSSQRLSGETYRKVSLRFGSNPFWSSCIESFGKRGYRSMDVSAVKSLHKALELTYYADCVGQTNYVAPDCFIYLIERLLTNIFYLKGCFFSSKSCVLEWLINREWNKNSRDKFVADWQEQFSHVLDITAAILAELLCNEQDVITWMKNSRLGLPFYPFLVLRLFVALCLLCVNSGKYYDFLFELLGRTEITAKLPPEFYNFIQKLKPGNLEDNVLVLAKAFRRIGNSLVVVSSGECRIKYGIWDGIFVDLKVHQGREKLIGILFKYR